MNQDDAAKLIATIAAQFLVHGQTFQGGSATGAYVEGLTSDEAISAAKDLVRQSTYAAMNLKSEGIVR